MRCHAMICSKLMATILQVMLIILNSSCSLLTAGDLSGSGTYHWEHKIDGDFMVGGIYPVREDTHQNSGRRRLTSCSGDLVMTYVIQTEAHLFYLNKHNEYLKNQKNFTLGTLLVDSCRNSDTAFRRSVQFIPGQKSDFCFSNKQHNFSAEYPIVMAAGGSEVAFYVSKLLSVYCIPFLSFDATSSFLSNRDMYPFFLRVVPSDQYQAKALISLLSTFQWNHAGIIYQDSFYGRHLKQDLLQLLNCLREVLRKEKEKLAKVGMSTFSRDNLTVCAEWVFEIPSTESPAYNTLHDYLNETHSPKVLIIIMDHRHAAKLLDRHINIPKSTNQYQLIGVDGWTGTIFGPASVVNNSIGTEPWDGISNDFETHMKMVNLSNALSPWLQVLIQQQHNCCYETVAMNCSSTNVTICSGSEKLKSDRKAVTYSLRYAERVRIGLEILNDTLIRIHDKECQATPGLCEHMKKINGSYLTNQMLKHPHFIHKTNGAHPHYRFVYYNNGAWEDIGSYKSKLGNDVDQFVVNKTHITSVMGSRWNEIVDASNSCFRACKGGYPAEEWAGTCCWECKFCTTATEPYNYVKLSENQAPQCSTCSPPLVPTADKRQCTKGMVHYVERTEAVIWLPLCLVLLGFIVSCACISILCCKRYRWGPLLKASGQNLLILTAAGPTSLYILASFGLGICKTVAASCGFFWVSLSLTLAVSQITIFLKSQRLHHSCSDCREQISFLRLHVESEKCIIALAATIHMGIVAIWAVIATPKVVYIPDYNPTNLGYKAICSVSANHYSAMLFMFPLFIVLATAFSLFKSNQKIRTHFRMQEHRYLSVSTMVSAALYMAILIPCIVEVEIKNFLNFRFGIIMTGMIFLGFSNLLPSFHIIYLLLFRPTKNSEEYIEMGLFSFAQMAKEFIITRQDISVDEAHRLGEGNFAEVLFATWKVKQSQHAHSTREKSVAVKRLKQCAANQHNEKKFYEEAFIMSQLGHPNIVKFYGICQTGYRFTDLMVMEYISGGCLEDYLQQNKFTLKGMDLVGFCKDICSACEYLEERQFVHRDIKASNCLIEHKIPAGPDSHALSLPVVKLSDFGMAKDINHNSCYKCTGDSIMPVYTAPESLNGEFTTKSDVWMFGILMWQVFHFGDAPMQRFHVSRFANFVGGIGKSIFNHDDTLHLEASQMPRNIYEVMHSCMQLNPDGRPEFHKLKHILASCYEAADAILNQGEVTEEIPASTNPETPGTSGPDNCSAHPVCFEKAYI